MDDRVRKWFFDIKFSIDEIESYFESEKRDFYRYRENQMLKRAIERNLEIIGEAMNRILNRDPEISERITSSKAIVGLRNQIIHAYDNVSDENIWSILITHLPLLKSEVENILQ